MTNRKPQSKSSRLSLLSVARMAELPFHIEVAYLASGELKCVLGGILHIVHYSSQKMSFSHKKGAVTIVGFDLKCTTYSNGMVEVLGRIDSIVVGEEA